LKKKTEFGSIQTGKLCGFLNYIYLKVYRNFEPTPHETNLGFESLRRGKNGRSQKERNLAFV